MRPQLPDLIGTRGAGNTAIRIHGYALQALPVTLTVVLGPLIAIAYRLTQSLDAAPGSPSVAQALRGLLCALMLLCLFFTGGLPRLTDRLARPLLFLAVYAALTAFWGPYPYQQIVFAVKMTFVTAVLVSTLQLAREGLIGERWLTFCAWIILLTMVVCIGIGLITGRTFYAYNSRYATAGLMNHIGVAAVFILATLPVFLRLTAVSRSAWAGLGLVYVLLFFTMCRGPLLAAAAATGCSFLINLNPWRRRIPWHKTLVPLAVLLLLVGIGLCTTAGSDLLARFRELNPQEGTGSGRYIFWKISVEHLLHRPVSAQVWGEGMGSIRDLLKEQFGLAIGSHNDWLDFVYAFGWCGLIAMGWWYWELARLAWRLRDHRDGLFQGTCAAGIILGLLSLGCGGSFEPTWALTFAALGFWAGHAARAQPPGRTPGEAESV